MALPPRRVLVPAGYSGIGRFALGPGLLLQFILLCVKLEEMDNVESVSLPPGAHFVLDVSRARGWRAPLDPIQSQLRPVAARALISPRTRDNVDTVLPYRQAVQRVFVVSTEPSCAPLLLCLASLPRPGAGEEQRGRRCA